MIAFSALKSAAALWSVSGSFGRVCGDFSAEETECRAESEAWSIRTVHKKDASGVVFCTGSFENRADHPVTVQTLLTRFCFHGGDYEVYTQFNASKSESIGAWQPLVTTVAAESRSVRTSYGANPMLALWSVQEQRGVVFHLLPQYAWLMRVRRVPQMAPRQTVEVEIGLHPDDLALTLGAGASLKLPQILYYEFTNKTDLDCWRLHRYANTHFPSKPMPVIYNTWLFCFDHIDRARVEAQVEKAAAIGCEYFVVDAGWFGKADRWTTARGDWSEKPTGAFGGKMTLLADHVRQCGMKFGLWFEIETADPSSDIAALHPEYFLRYENRLFLDFRRQDAREYIFAALEENIAKYGIEFLKFDFNQDMYLDETGDAFCAWHNGYQQVIDRLKAAYPNIYLENCASGGQRMNLANCRDFDSFWLSDDQSVIDGIRIVKDSMLRLPPRMIERWAVVESREDFEIYNATERACKLISCNDGTWSNVEGVQLPFLEAFLLGGVIGFSCDLTHLNEEHTAFLRELTDRFKAERDFWQNAECRILCDTNAMLALQYSDPALTKVKIFSIKRLCVQDGVTVHPVLDPEKRYSLNGEPYPGGGVEFISRLHHTAHFAELTAE